MVPILAKSHKIVLSYDFFIFVKLESFHGLKIDNLLKFPTFLLQPSKHTNSKVILNRL